MCAKKGGDNAACSRPLLSPFALVEVPLQYQCTRHEIPEEERTGFNPWALISTSFRCLATLTSTLRNL
jgi:hypothetical protein